MAIRDALRKYPDIETDLVLAHILKKDKDFLYLYPKKVLTASQVNKFDAMAKQRLQGMPLAYVLGYKNFYGLRFNVSRSVLIPRPESEWLVDTTLEQMEKRPGPLKILDMGTGSGCLILSIAALAKRKNIHYTAIDISKKALAMAKKNAVKHHLNVEFLHSNLFHTVHKKFDIVLANLPYVPFRDYKSFYDNLKYEPRQSLSIGNASDNPWTIYKKFLRNVPAYVNPGALILMEIDPGSVKQLKKWAMQYLKSSTVNFYKDFNGLWRYCCINISKF